MRAIVAYLIRVSDQIDNLKYDILTLVNDNQIISWVDCKWVKNPLLQLVQTSIYSFLSQKRITWTTTWLRRSNPKIGRSDWMGRVQFMSLQNAFFQYLSRFIHYSYEHFPFFQDINSWARFLPEHVLPRRGEKILIIFPYNCEDAFLELGLQMIFNHDLKGIFVIPMKKHRILRSYFTDPPLFTVSPTSEKLLTVDPPVYQYPIGVL